MKNFSLALLLLSIILFSFKVNTPPPATPIRFDDNQTGSFTIFNQCTSEEVDVTFRSSQNIRGAINGQRFTIKIQYNEQQEGVGRTSGMRYVGHVNESYNEHGNFVTSRYDLSHALRIRMVAQGGQGHYRAKSELNYSLNTAGEVTSYLERQTSECD